MDSTWCSVAKLQISSTKYQTTLKSQYSKTKTIGQHLSRKDMFEISNFDHAQRRRLRRVLEFVCHLRFVIWNLPRYHPS
jgi:hypothetical protein